MDTVPTRETVSLDDARATVRALVHRLRGLPVADNTYERLRLLAALGLNLHDTTTTAQAAALGAGALRLLKATLCETDDEIVHRVTLATMLLLVHDNAHAQDAVIRADILNVLRDELYYRTSSVLILTTMLMHSLVRDSAAHRNALLDACAFTPLYRLLCEGYGVQRDHAQRVLAALFAHDDSCARAQGEAIGLELPADLQTLAMDRIWDARAFAHCVLTRYVHARDLAGDPAAALTRLTHALQHHSTPAHDALVVLEELKCLIADHPGLASTEVALMKTTVVPLCLAWLRRGDCVNAASILVSLVERNDELRAHVTHTDNGGGVAALIQMLADGNSSVVFVLASLVRADDVCADAVAGGAIPLVVHVLSGRRQHEATWAARTLCYLVRGDTTAQIEALDAGAMGALLSWLRRDVVQMLVRALQGLVDRNAAAQDAFLAAGGARVVSQLCDSSEDNGAVAVAAASVIQYFIENYLVAQAAFTRTGVIHSLCRLLVDCSVAEAEAPASALLMLARGHQVNCGIILRGAVPRRLVELLRIGDDRVQLVVASTIYFVTKGYADAGAQRCFAYVGAIEPLVRLLDDSRALDVPWFAAAALGSLVHNNPLNQATVVAAGAVTPLITMIRECPPHYAYTAATALAYLLDMAVAATSNARDDDAQELVKNPAELVPLLVELLEARSLSSNDTSQVALALADLFCQDRALHAIAVEAGAKEALAALAQAADENESSFAKALSCLVDCGGRDGGGMSMAATHVNN